MISRTTIFKKSWHQFQGGCPSLKSISDNTLYYEVTDLDSGKEHLVEITTDPVTKSMTTNCTCTFKSLNKTPCSLCSHQITALRQATQDLGNPNNKKLFRGLKK